MNICIFGDSITWGAYDPNGGGWANRLRFDWDKNKDDVDVMVLGIPGETSDGLKSRIGEETKHRNPKIIIIAIGINDSMMVDIKNGKPNVEIIDFEKNLEIIRVKTIAITEKIIMIGLTEVDETKTWPGWWNRNQGYRNEIIEKYNIALGLWCQKNKIPMISLQGILEKNDYFDGLHPNSNGHEKIYKKIVKEVGNLGWM